MTAPLFHTVTLFTAYPDMVKKLGAALVAFAVPTREEPGCRRFEVFQDCDEPTRFTMIGDWTDESAHRDHLNAQHTLTRLQHPTIQRLGLGIRALFRQHYRQIANVGERIGMLNAQHTLTRLECPTN